MMFKHPSVYILASDKDGTLQVGMASSMKEGLRQHQGEGADKLVWYELHECLATAREQEQILKESDAGSIRKMIEQTNPDWKNLYDDIT